MVAIEDFTQSTIYLLDQQYLADGRGQEYFAHVIPTLGVLSMYLHVIQVPAIKAILGSGQLALIGTHITNLLRSTLIQLPGYDIAGEMFADPSISYWEALAISFGKYAPERGSKEKQHK